jgi:hypothetical protein
MDIRELVRALLEHEGLRVRAWLNEAARQGLRWDRVSRPEGLDDRQFALAAGVVETMARDACTEPPDWVFDHREAAWQVFLVRAAATMPRLRRMCETQGPEPLRRRGFLAPPEFLRVA